MKSPDGLTKSSWYAGVEIPDFSELQGTTSADVCIVGAGIAGLTAAYLLTSQGLHVVVLDEGEIGGGQTGRTSAHLASALDDRFFEMEKLHGVELTKLAHQSHAAAIDTIEKISSQEQIDCDFARVDAFLSMGKAMPADQLDREFEAAKRAEVGDLELKASGGIANARCICFGNQAVFHPMRYLVGLAQAVTRLGGQIFTGKRVKDVQGVDPKTKKPGRVSLVGGASVVAQHVIVATNTPSPINDWFGIYTKQSSYRSYMIAMEIPRESIPNALFWDMEDPYHYARLQRNPRNKNDLLLVGGEDHKTGQEPSDAVPFDKLESWTRQNFPTTLSVQYRWSGQIQEPADGFAFLGRAKTATEEVFVITGDSGMGLTHGTIGAMLITDLIQGRPNPWENLYDPSRKIANTEFLKENLNTVAQYKDLITPGDVSNVAEIAAGSGAIIREGLKKLAVYRDPEGELYRHSAVCTHLQCIVHWNDIEKSWDCPCHGSRFDAKGKVLIGPATNDLPAD